MQTFLPLPSFIKSAQVLDYRRLGKQRVEAMQIIDALEGRSKGWVNHPATQMWRGYEYALKVYHDVMVQEWKRRGYRNTMPYLAEDVSLAPLPLWFGNPEFHASHRSNLLRKDSVYYGQFGWAEGPNLLYVWPI